MDLVRSTRQVLRRIRWELYSARVAARRWALDVLLSRRRRQCLLQESCLFRNGADAIFRITGLVSVEPKYGYVVKDRYGVIEESLMASMCVRTRADRADFSGVPSLRDLRSTDRAVPAIGTELVSIQHAFGGNHYHAVVDCIGALALIEQHVDLTAIPIVIGTDLGATSAFRAIVDGGLIGADRLIVRDHRWISSAEAIIFAQHDALDARSLRRTAAFIRRIAPPETDRQLKLYVLRGATSQGRVLRNDDEVAAELVARGFEVIDPGTLPWDQQYERFRAARHVVGVHGAALTNVLYRSPHPLSILEITPPGHRAEVFRMMAEQLGYEFTRIEGTAASGRGRRASFVVDVSRILDVVDRWGASDRPAQSPPGGIPPLVTC
jgi:capsular polysaccharide biosynthesis protein